MKKDDLLEEWKDIRETLRYFGNKRFAQLTVFLAGMAFLFNGYYSKENPMPTLVAGIIGVVVSLLFLIMELSAVAYWEAFARRGEEVEKILGTIEMMSKHRPKEKCFKNGTLATYILYWVFGIFWILVVLNVFLRDLPQGFYACLCK